MLAILTFIIVLGLLVFVHEAGHFVVAKRAGMGVEEFGFGFPPRMFGVQKRDGTWRIVSRESRVVSREHDPQSSRLTPHASRLDTHASRLTPTIYSFNWIPLGGFVRITGENGDTDDPRSFAAKPRLHRALVLLAGVAMNLVLAVVLFTTVAAVGAPQVLDGVGAGAEIRDRATRIVAVLPDGPAAAAGVQPGDAIARVDAQAFATAADVQAYIRAHMGRALDLELLRGGATVRASIQPVVLAETGKPGIGVQLIETGTVAYTLPRAVVQGVRATGAVLAEILRSVGALVSGLVREQRVAVDIAGPVGIAVMTGQVVELGFVYLLQFAAVLSANLALLNVLPFPALDGGRLFLLMIEAIRRRALAKRVENAIHAVGYAVLLLLVLVVTYHDIVTFGGTIVGSLRNAVGF